MSWYVVRCNIKCEDKAERNLRSAGFRVYVPRMKIERQQRRTKKWIITELPLFPRYLFLEQKPKPDWFTARRCEGVEGVLGALSISGEVEPFPVPSRHVERLMAMQADLAFDDTRTAKIRRREIGRNKRETTRMRFPVGSRVRAKDGPFAMLGGIVTNVKARGTVEVMIELFGTLSPAEFPHEWLEVEDEEQAA